jgi:hypothetical protein
MSWMLLQFTAKVDIHHLLRASLIPDRGKRLDYWSLDRSANHYIFRFETYNGYWYLYTLYSYK